MKTKNLIFLIDLSGSMASKAQAVNLCMNNIYSSVFPEIINQSSEDVEYLFKAIGFSSRFKDFVSEIVSEQNIKDLHTWKDLKEDQFNGSTPTGAAILKVVNDFNSKSRGEPNNLPALIVLISDGEANGENPTYEEVIHDAETSRDLGSLKYCYANRVAIAIDPTSESERQLRLFGKISSKMKAEGLDSYFDVSNDYAEKLVKILEMVTIRGSLL